jgi:hypothetical protein
MSYCNRTALLFLPILLTLSSFILSGSIVVAKGKTNNDGKVALNSATFCGKNAPSFLTEREDKSMLLMAKTNCALLTHAVFAALRDAKYKPQNLRDKRDFEQFMEGALAILEKNSKVNRIYNNLDDYFSSSVIGQVVQGSTAAYLLLDYGIDVRKFDN